MVDAQARRPTVRHLDEVIAIRPRDRNPHAASSVILADLLCRPDSCHAGLLIRCGYSIIGEAQ
jgi:hypothetical protein